MKFVDDLFKLYKDHFNSTDISTDEAAIEIVLTLFADHKREDLMKFISELSDDEVFQMVSLYVIELVKRKISKEVMNRNNDEEVFPIDPNVH